MSLPSVVSFVACGCGLEGVKVVDATAGSTSVAVNKCLKTQPCPHRALHRR